MFHDITDKIKAAGITPEEIVEACGRGIVIVGSDIMAVNRGAEARALRYIEGLERKQFDGSASTYKQPYFKHSGDGWVVVARGCDFIEDSGGAPIVKVRKRDGSISRVDVIEAVDMTSTEVRSWQIP
ncbi:MAG: hypothetical protein LBU48_03300 [Coriobacteriales bacterium]|jgi:hypothetical protein|nr:hypothetical protein [Coriobacteriales bacterium]